MFLKHIYLSVWLYLILVVARGSLDLGCGTQDPSLWQVGSSSMTRDRTWAPVLGVQSQPLDQQGSPHGSLEAKGKPVLWACALSWCTTSSALICGHSKS